MAAYGIAKQKHDEPTMSEKGLSDVDGGGSSPPIIYYLPGETPIYMIKSACLAKQQPPANPTDEAGMPPHPINLYPHSTANLTSNVDPADLNASLTELLADTFHDNPFLTFILKPINDRPDLCASFRRFLYARRLELWREHSWTICTVHKQSSATTNIAGTAEEELRVEGHVSWQPPSPARHMAPSLWTLIRMGFLKIPLRYGLGVTRRFLAVVDAITSHQDDVRRDHPDKLDGCAWVVEALALEVGAQGKGLGGRLMRKISEESGDEGAWLMTQEEGNVKFYEKVGFVVLDQRRIVLQNKEDGFENWIMWRPGNK